MKKLMVLIAVAATAACTFAGPHGGPGGRGPGGRGPGGRGPGGPGGGPGMGWRGPHAGVPHHDDAWGRGGRNFWPGFVGGVVGAALVRPLVTPPPPPVSSTVVVSSPTVVTTPVVVSQPVVTTTPVTTVQNVWVEGRYVDQVQPNGSVIRVWSPGHYEQRSVIVQ